MSEVLETEAAIERHVAIMPPSAGIADAAAVVAFGGGVVVVVGGGGGFGVVSYDFEIRLRKRSEDIYSSMRRPDGESDDDPYSR